MHPEEIFAYASSGIVPIRTEPADSSEMTTQMLLGETCRILERKRRWSRIRADFDDYEGWVNSNEITPLKQNEWEQWRNNPNRVRSPYFTFRACDENKDCVLVPAGAYVVIKEDSVGLPGGNYTISSSSRRIKEQTILETAATYLGTPYLWGGRTDVGIDCSGFVQSVLSLHDVTFPRDSSKQFEAVETEQIPLKEIKKGDLIYFSPKSERVSHLGFYNGNGVLLHASGRVKYELINTKYTGESPFPLNKRLANSITAVQRLNKILKG